MAEGHPLPDMTDRQRWHYDQGITLYREGHSAAECLDMVWFGEDSEANAYAMLRLAGWMDAMLGKPRKTRS
jgi:hypothetical protein